MISPNHRQPNSGQTPKLLPCSPRYLPKSGRKTAPQPQGGEADERSPVKHEGIRSVAGTDGSEALSPKAAERMVVSSASTSVDTQLNLRSPEATTRKGR